jgi:bifunctional UDP-N-acetylglucosamine pyrophosphorylase/glucosamine-1-phosphate N-acetyltransferase
MIGQDAVILPFSVIEHDVVVGAHCEVGPFAHLRPGTVLDEHAEIGNFVEVKKSRVGPHSKAKHLTYLGDATLGAHVNIGAGTITANYDGTNKHATAIADGASTGSNTVLVAPVKLGKGSKTGAGAVVLHDVPAGAVVVGVPAVEKKTKKSSPGKVRKRA